MYQNPMNDYYLRQPYQQQLNFPPNPQPAVPQIRASWVSNIEEARASQMDFVSTNIYCDTSTGKIYLKRIGDNGKPLFLTYEIENNDEQDPIREINTRLSKIETLIGGLRNESVSNNASVQQSQSVPYTAVAKQNESNDEAKSAGFPENAGNDKWQKRK